MITLEGVHARGAAIRGKPTAYLRNVALSWERGVLAVIGTPADGTTALLEVLAGSLKLRGGRVLVDGVAPAEARARIVHVPLDAPLPEALRVEEVCDLAAELRGEPRATAVSRLEPLGLAALAQRRVRFLSPAEVRAVSLAIAITSRANVLLVEEPLAGLEPSAPARVIEALRARGAAGAAVIVTTASVRDATRLADQLALLTQGAFSHLSPALAHVGREGARLRVVVAANSAAEVSPFVSALSQETAVGSVELATFNATRVLHAAITVVVGGRDLLALARAVGAAAARTGAAVEAIESAVLPLDAIRGATVAPRPGIAPEQAPPPAPAQPVEPPPPLTPPGGLS